MDFIARAGQFVRRGGELADFAGRVIGGYRQSSRVGLDVVKRDCESRNFFLGGSSRFHNLIDEARNVDLKKIECVGQPPDHLGRNFRRRGLVSGVRHRALRRGGRWYTSHKAF